MTVELWTEKYRPQSLDEYVWADPNMRVRAEEWIEEGALPNLLLHGASGLGKTSLALLLLEMLKIPEGDRLFIAASRERRVDDIQDRIASFVNTWAMGETGIKYIILDEFDAVSPLAQKMLRTDMETESGVCRFIASVNYVNKVLPAIRSRMIEIAFQTMDREDFVVRCGTILTTEQRQFEFDDLMAYANASFPDMRKCISLLQDNSRSGTLQPLRGEDVVTKDYLLEMVELFRRKRFGEARKLIVAQAQVEEYPDIYRFLYQNLNLFGSCPDVQDDALLILRKAVVDQAIVADQEILLSATLVELGRVAG